MLRNYVSRMLGERRESVRDLARGTGLSYSTCYDWYAGRVKRFDASTVEALCEYFQCGVGDLLEYVPGQEEEGKALAA